MSAAEATRRGGSMVEYRILGSVEVYDGGWAVDLGGFRERTLLARLLVSANRVVSDANDQQHPYTASIP
jgi:hypothetical protein